MNREAELQRAVDALIKIAHGRADDGAPWGAAECWTIAREALEDMHQMQFVESAKYSDRGEW